MCPTEQSPEILQPYQQPGERQHDAQEPGQKNGGSGNFQTFFFFFFQKIKVKTKTHLKTCCNAKICIGTEN